jgi:glyoxylase-like metal-dependent hydrolase (beta-lactamase superfamily II)
MIKRLNWILLSMILVIGLPYYWLLLDNRPGNIPAKPIQIAQLRQLAASMPGPLPASLEVEIVASRRLPANLFVAGAGMKSKLVAVMAWRLLVPGGKSIVIDSGITPSAVQKIGMTAFFTDAQARVDTAMREAGLILVTHEHADHLGALVALGGSPLTSAARLNAQQLPSAPLATQMIDWPKGITLQARITAGGPQAVAPGIVVIPAPSHTPGSQMIYARLADGREYLFAGDIATFAQSWQQLRARSHLLSDYFAPENRTEVFAWLKTIQSLQTSAPAMTILAGHDYEWLFIDKKFHGIQKRFGPEPDEK